MTIATKMSNPLCMKKHWKRMDQSSFTIKNIQILVEIPPAIVSKIFLNETENIITLCNKMTFFYLLCERCIMAVKAYHT